MALLQSGKPNKIIAYDLDITEATVKVHMRNIMRKLKLTNRTQVAAWSVIRSERPLKGR